ncbi:hypothetical protein B9Z55_004410 [Caenorhabditis nigoni]|uniref:DUF7809 domain-containing protein n=1 Tax=Caenorhabditis nigoni TaxID=1611254 RepID=A0A2G5UWE3_9PELO|nr:hypothetical protein B9Z55_004410 [Caenorhabditis nigoni]
MLYFDGSKIVTARKCSEIRNSALNSFRFRKSIEDVQNFLTKGVDSNQTLEEILAIGDPDLRMYGTVEELAENIKIFKNFPESFRFFSAITPNTSFVYKNLKNEDFFCKSDLLTIIRNVALFVVQDHPLLSQFNYDLGQFLRELVPGSSEHVEFWKFDFATYNGIWKEISDGHNEANRNTGRLRDELTPYVRDRHFNYIDSKMKEFNSIAWHEDNLSFFSNMFKSKKCTDKDIMNRLYVYFVDAGTMNCFRKLIDSRPALFGSNPKTVAPTVRLFEDGPFKFMMKEELFNGIDPVYAEIEESQVIDPVYEEIPDVEEPEVVHVVEEPALPTVQNSINMISLKFRELDNGLCENLSQKLKLLEENGQLRKPNPKTVAPTVRLFEDGPFKFVMKQELFNGINRNSDSSNFILFNESEKHVISSMEWDDVLEFYGDRIGDIEFRKSIEDVQNFLTEGVDSNQTLEEILAIGDPDLRMYCTVEELAENIKIFKNFPESFRFFSAITPNTSFVYKKTRIFSVNPIY